VSLVDGRGGELEGSPNVAAGELRIFGHHIVRCQALGDQTDDRGNRNSRAGNARHATHHAVIGDHSISCHEESVTPERSATVSVGFR